jgi:hypothetical protein
VLGLSVFLATLGPGCSSSGADGEWVSQAQFAERFASVWCQSVAPCCAPAELAYDSATCQAQARDFAASMLASRISGDTTYSAAAGTHCLARLERALKSCELEEASSACALIFVGSSANGSPCAKGSACASGYCALGEAALSGVCAEASYQSPHHGKAGEPCVGSCGVPGAFSCPTSLLPSSEGTTNYCYAEDGLYCSFDSELLDALSCRPYAAVDAACADANCIPGAFCADGICVAQHASGSCADSPEQCAAHGYCDASQQCQPKKPNGAPCLSGEECTSSSCSSAEPMDGVCDTGNTLLQRACSGTP